MENRFGIKDLFLFLLIVGLVVLVVLAMKQVDRQWEAIQETRQLVKDQTADLATIRAELSRQQQNADRARSTRPTTRSSTSPSTEPTTAPATNPAANGSLERATDGEELADERVIANHRAPDYIPGDRVIDTFAAPPDKLTPLINDDQYSTWIQEYVLDYLLERDPNTFAWRPRLATRWSQSADGLKFDFWLRRDAVFSNNDPVTADDVVFTMQWTMNEAVEAPRSRSYLDKFDHIEKIDDYHVRFVFKEPYFKSFETAALTQVMSKKFYSQFTPKQFNESSGLLLGSGPYRLPSPGNWQPSPGKPVELVRNERYWGEPAGFDRILWAIISEESSRLIEFRNRGTDVLTRPSPEQYEAIKDDPEFSRKVNLFPMDVVNSGYTYIGWNQKLNGKPTPFADARVRRAMTMLLDRERIVEDIFRSMGSVATGPFNHLSPQYDPSVQPLPYDPIGARKLLEEAGYKRQRRQLIGPDGKPFKFELLYNSSNPVRRQIASYVADALAGAGIVAEPTPIEWVDLLQRTKERRFDAVVMGWAGVIEDDPTQIFHSSAIAGTGDNFVQYSNPKLDAQIEKAKTTMDDAARMKLWHQVHRTIAEDQPYSFLCADWDLAAASKRIKGAERTNTGLNAKTEWYSPAASRRMKQ